ncbi:MAG: hypothetical protein J6Z14_01900 [Prevotella sp.]|nr:hypothetical protein [Prevotella sp.]
MMKTKSNYQKPAITLVKVQNQHLLASTGGGDGPFESRQERSDWSED